MTKVIFDISMSLDGFGGGYFCSPNRVEGVFPDVCIQRCDQSRSIADLDLPPRPRATRDADDGDVHASAGCPRSVDRMAEPAWGAYVRHTFRRSVWGCNDLPGLSGCRLLRSRSLWQYRRPGRNVRDPGSDVGASERRHDVCCLGGYGPMLSTLVSGSSLGAVAMFMAQRVGRP